MARKRRKIKKSFLSIKLKIYGILILSFLLILFYYACLRPNVNIRTDYCYFYIPANSNASTVYDSLKSKGLLKTNFDFWLMQKAFGDSKPAEGLYQLHKGWGNLWLVKKLKEGNNNPYITLEVPSYKSRSNTLKNICKQVNINFKEFKQTLQDTVFLADELNLDKESTYCIFIPGNYKVYKHITSQQLLTDLFSYYNLFWNGQRRKAAKKIKCSPEDVIKLASIVYAETKDTTEMPIIAGLYLNRLRKNMHLQADPTLVYAHNSINTKRVYFKYLASPSPYNTYKYKGLPPGPIGPSPLIAIESVLNSTRHNYLFFCAKEDQSGCHYFAEDFEEHKKNAVRYRKGLDKKRIK